MKEHLQPYEGLVEQALDGVLQTIRPTGVVRTEFIKRVINDDALNREWFSTQLFALAARTQPQLGPIAPEDLSELVDEMLHSLRAHFSDEILVQTSSTDE